MSSSLTADQAKWSLSACWQSAAALEVRFSTRNGTTSFEQPWRRMFRTQTGCLVSPWDRLPPSEAFPSRRRSESSRHLSVCFFWFHFSQLQNQQQHYWLWFVIHTPTFLHWLDTSFQFYTNVCSECLHPHHYATPADRKLSGAFGSYLNLQFNEPMKVQLCLSFDKISNLIPAKRFLFFWFFFSDRFGTGAVSFGKRGANSFHPNWEKGKRSADKSRCRDQWCFLSACTEHRG